MKIAVAFLVAASITCLTTRADTPDLLEVAKSDSSVLKEIKSIVSLVDGKEDIRVQYGPDAGYPGVKIPAPAGGWDLSEYQGIEAEITNEGSAARGIALRVDNNGTGESSNTETAKIGPGATKTIKVKFGYSYGNPAFQLNSAAITSLLVFVNKPAEEGVFTIRNVRPFKEEASAAAAPKPAAEGENNASPNIGGELLDLAKGDALAGFRFFHSKATIENGKVNATFATDTDYPSLQFPIPVGGWNLTAFGGVQVMVTNKGNDAVTIVLRVDNPGDWKKSPWNSQSVKIGPGSTELLQVVFGQSNGKPSFALDTSRVTGIQIFLTKPKQETTLELSDLKAYGSPDATSGKSTLTSQADRNVPVTPPDWLGQRPPIEGDWILTFEDNFDGATLDAAKWEASNSHFSKFFFYQKEKVNVQDGVLKLSAEKKPVEGREYISGQVTGFGKWAQSYGYFEARVKLPGTRGFWPAFWLMPDRDVKGPTDQKSIWDRNSTKWGGMEFDILEHLSEWGAGRHNVAVHWDGYGDLHKAWGDTHVYYGPTPDGWHNFGMLWEPGKLTWFIDGKKTAEWENPRVGAVPGHMLLSLQLGGWATKDIDLSKINETFDIDYVRVWQRKDLAEVAAKVDLSIPDKNSL